MLTERFLAWTMVGAMTVAMAGCCSYPVSDRIKKAAKATENVSFDAIRSNAATYKGATFVWGGRILKLDNQTTGSALYVLQFPLDKCGYPQLDRYSQGRFVAVASQFLDPEMLKKGRLVTVAGTISGETKSEKIGQSQYNYPVLHLEEVHLWLPGRTYPVPYWSFWGGYGAGWHDYWLGPPHYYGYPYFGDMFYYDFDVVPDRFYGP